MSKQIDNAAIAHAAHQASQARRDAFHAPQKQNRSDQIASGPATGFPTDPADKHKFGPGRDGGDGSKLCTGL
jgi:hypothetical protein